MKQILGIFIVSLLWGCNSSRQEEMRLLLEQTLREDDEQKLLVSDSVPLLLTDYFTLHGTRNDQMRAYYLLGRTFDCKDNHIMAIRFYHEAIEKTDTLADDADYATLSKAFAHSAKLYNVKFDGRPTIALEDGRRALHYAQLANNEHLIKISQGIMANCFRNLGQWDSIQRYDSILYNMIVHPEREQQTRYISFYPSFLFVNHDDLRPFKERMPIMGFYPADLSVVSKDKPLLITSFAHAEERPTDRDSILSISNLSGYIDMKLREQRYRDRQNNMLVLMLMTSCFLLLTGWLVYRHKLHKIRARIVELNTQYSMDLSDYQLLSMELSVLRQNTKEKDEQIIAKEQQLEKLQQQLATQQGDHMQPSLWRVPDDVLNAPIFTSLHRKASIGRKADGKDWRELRQLANTSMPDFMTALMQLDGTLDDTNMMFCFLTKLRFLPSELAILFDKSSQAVTNRKVRLLKRLFHKEGGAKLFDVEILHLRA